MSFWFCPLQLQLCNSGSQHLKKSDKQKISFSIKSQMSDQMKFHNEKSYSLPFVVQEMQSTPVFTLWIITLKKNTAYYLTCKRELTGRKGNVKSQISKPSSSITYSHEKGTRRHLKWNLITSVSITADQIGVIQQHIYQGEMLPFQK